MHFSLENGTLPLLTTKKVAWKTCLKELLWFINGDTDNRNLKSQNVKIWNANATRDFLDSRGLTSNAVDDLGPVYGHQWRYFNAPYTTCNESYEGKGVDHLMFVEFRPKTARLDFHFRCLQTLYLISNCPRMEG